MSTNLIEIIRIRLERERTNYATSALSQPDVRDPAFSYGRACGHHLAMTHALGIIQDTVREDNERDRDEPPPTFAG